jgi:hypothetical protein
LVAGTAVRATAGLSGTPKPSGKSPAETTAQTLAVER